jgi:hypothetical protein
MTREDAFRARLPATPRSTLIAGAALVGIMAAGIVWAQPPAATGDVQIYHVSAFRAAPGHYDDVLKMLTAPAADGPRHYAVVFRHVDGSAWDFMTVEHMGRTATIEAPTAAQISAPPSRLSEIVAWHGDTFAWGPSLDEFRRALNLPATPSGAASTSVYTITDYMALPGHRGELLRVIDQIAKDSQGQSVRLTHMEGAPWQFLLLTRSTSWRQFGEQRETPAQAAGSPPPVGVQLRQHMTEHHDTVATVAAIVPAGQ